jgi:hypothetical protein
MMRSLGDAAQVDGEDARRIAADALHVAGDQRLHHQALDRADEQRGGGGHVQAGVELAAARPRSSCRAAARRTGAAAWRPPAWAPWSRRAAVRRTSSAARRGARPRSRCGPGTWPRSAAARSAAACAARRPGSATARPPSVITASRMASLVGKCLNSAPWVTPMCWAIAVVEISPGSCPAASSITASTVAARRSSAGRCLVRMFTASRVSREETS